MSQRRLGGSSVRSTRSEPIFQRPAFHGQNSSVTSMTKEPFARYERADKAALRSSRRTQRPSRRRNRADAALPSSEATGGPVARAGFHMSQPVDVEQISPDSTRRLR